MTSRLTGTLRYDFVTQTLEQGEKLLLATRRQSLAATNQFAMTRKSKLGMTGAELRALREEHGLTQVQIAQLGRMKVFARGKGITQSSQVGSWENGIAIIPEAAAELIRAKLYLLGAGVATLDQLIEYPLDAILRDIYS